jgi:hypothetical protein
MVDRHGDPSCKSRAALYADVFDYQIAASNASVVSRYKSSIDIQTIPLSITCVKSVIITAKTNLLIIYKREEIC